MLNEIKKHIDLFKFLCSCNNKVRTNIIKGLSKEHILCICECILNILNGNIELDNNDKERIKRFRKYLRKLVKKGQSLRKRKQILVQKGGSFLPLLLPIIVSAVSSLF
jgi:hypothetical protein